MRKPFRIAAALIVSAAVALVAGRASRFIPLPAHGFLPPSFVTHTVMLALSLALMWTFSKGRLGLYGLGRGTYRFSPRIFLWILPMAVLATMGAMASRGGGDDRTFGGLGILQHVVFVWIYASVAEEVLTRGLLQTLLSSGSGTVPPGRRVSMPVIVSALFFGAMHLVLLDTMGAFAVVVIIMSVVLGLVAGRYREATGSLIPAVIVHCLFNIGGILPLWIVLWLRR
jgi:membrane protease YdiL (CAAX protease family)